MVIRLCEGRLGITRREWRIIALLAQDEGLLSSQLAERAQLDRARTSKAITSLVLEINRELLAALTAAEVERLDGALDALQQRADSMMAQAELPKADRRRGAGTRRQPG